MAIQRDLLGRANELLRRTVLENPYIPHTPTPRQAVFLVAPVEEALYGGAAGGGKTDCMLMAALQYVYHPKYAALLLRKTFADLKQPGSLIPRSLGWLADKARWSAQDKQWTFPSGAVIKFGYLDTANDIYQYQSSQFQFVGFDELTHFTEAQYRYLFSRLRQDEDMTDVPIRMRAASNPGGVGHQWVKRRFLVEGKKYGRLFVPAKLNDNPYLNREKYVKSLDKLDPTTRDQLLKGDWDAMNAGSRFQRQWFKVVRDVPRKDLTMCRYWDLAATEPAPGKDPDYTAGGLIGLSSEGQWYILDIVRIRASPMNVEKLIRQTAVRDGVNVKIRMEEEPGASGKIVIDHYARKVLVGFNFLGIRSTGSKVDRSSPVSSAAEAGNVHLVEGDWIGEFLDQAESFPEVEHDDSIDCVSGGFVELRRSGTGEHEIVDMIINRERGSFQRGKPLF